MRMAGQITPLAQSYIETVDVVLGAVPNLFTRKWLQQVVKKYVCLLDYYSDCDVIGKDQRDAYRRISDTIYVCKIAPTALLILWQPGLAGELSLKRFEITPHKLQVLVDKLARDYPLDHPVILYEAATNPLEKMRMDTVLLCDLPAAALRQATTLVILAAYPLRLDPAVMEQLRALNAVALSD